MPDKNLQQAMDEIKPILERYDAAAIVLLASPTHSEYLYKFKTSWTCTKVERDKDGETLLRVRAKLVDFNGDKARHMKVVTETVSVFLGFASLLDDAKRTVGSIAIMLRKTFDITHTETRE